MFVWCSVCRDVHDPDAPHVGELPAIIFEPGMISVYPFTIVPTAIWPPTWLGWHVSRHDTSTGQ